MNVLNELEWNILEMYLIYISTLSLLTDETQMCYVRNEIKIWKLNAFQMALLVVGSVQGQIDWY